MIPKLECKVYQSVENRFTIESLGSTKRTNRVNASHDLTIKITRIKLIRPQCGARNNKCYQKKSCHNTSELTNIIVDLRRYIQFSIHFLIKSILGITHGIAPSEKKINIIQTQNNTGVENTTQSAYGNNIALCPCFLRNAPLVFREDFSVYL